MTTTAELLKTHDASASYDAASIVVLSGLEAVRERPTMYIGATGHRGVAHLVQELLQNAIDEVIAGYAQNISLVAHDDGSFSVSDDGRGIPVDNHPATGRPAVEVVLTTLHSGAKFRRHAYTIAGGLHGVGLSCVNALAAWLKIEVSRGGRVYEQRFERGLPASKLNMSAISEKSGTSVHFMPDYELFGVDGPPSSEGLKTRLEELAFLHPGLIAKFLEEKSGETREYFSKGGIPAFVERVNIGRTAVHPAPIHVSGEHDGIFVDAALQWTTAYAEEIRSFVNGVATTREGTHVEGLKVALVRVLNRFAAEHELLTHAAETIPGFDIREGLTSVLSVAMLSPEFEGQTKTTLTSAEAAPAVEHIIANALAEAFAQNPQLGRLIVARALEASRARIAARRASERARYRSPDTLISKEVYKAQFGIRSKNWHESAKWITDQGLLGEHAKACKVSKDGIALDVCCGSGVVGNSFRGRVAKIIGLDLTPQMAALASTRLDEVRLGDVYNIPFPENTFDLCCNREVLHLLPQPERPLSEIFRVLKPGGQFIVGQWVPFSEVDSAWFFRIVKKKQPLFFNNLTAESMRSLIEKTGFEKIETTEYLQWEDIDTWIDTHETPSLNRYEIRDLYQHAPAEVRAVHPFEITAAGAIRDCWRWVIFSAFKPAR